MKPFRYHCYLNAQSIEEVKSQMDQLDVELKGTDMENLIAFNHTYLIITRNVYSKLGSNYFHNDEHMRAVDTRFGNYYFCALHRYISNKSCAPAWKLLFDACRRDDTYQFMYLALGVNAHVNNDLPQTLRDVMQSDSDDYDFLRINEIISNSIPEVIDSLQEKNWLLRLSQQVVKPLYAPLLQHIIQKWRANAWMQFMSCIDIQRIETSAGRKAQNIYKRGRFI